MIIYKKQNGVVTQHTGESLEAYVLETFDSTWLRSCEGRCVELTRGREAISVWCLP
jgi:hypothetical protein